MITERYNTFTVEDFIFDEDFRELVRKPDVEERIKELIEDLPNKRYEINMAVQIIRGIHITKFQQPYHRKKELWQQIVTKEKRKVQLTFIKYAAAILLLFGTGGTLYYLTTKNTKTELAANKFNSNSELKGNSNDAMLVLANGKTVSIKNKESTVKYSADGSGIMVNDSSGVGQNVKEGELNKMIVPFGKRSVITLSEGTKIWLNSGSTLVFPPAFKGKTREVQLIGEAYFEVIHNKEKPFYVKTDAFKMKVYGTKFDIQAYKQDNSSSIILVEGKVSMKSNNNSKAKEVFLAPHQKATLSDGSTNFDIDEVENMEKYTSWTEGYLTFTNEDINHLLKQVSRYYNVDIEVDATENFDKIYGKLDLKDDIEKVLDGLSFISKTKYKKIGNKYMFYQ